LRAAIECIIANRYNVEIIAQVIENEKIIDIKVGITDISEN